MRKIFQNYLQSTKHDRTRFFHGEVNIILTKPNAKDPEGYVCEKQVFDLKEVSNVLRVNCYEITEEICELVR